MPRLEGVDVKAGLESVNNDGKLYVKLLTNFHNRHRGVKEEIQTELEHGNPGVAQRLAHSIKGVAGTVGAKKLSEISSQLESAIKKDGSNRIPNLLDRFAKEVARVMAALDAFIQNEEAGRTEETTGGKELETPSFKKLFQELSNLIDERDSDAIKLVAKIKTLLDPSHISGDFLNLETQISSFKFEQATKALEQVTKELNL